MRPVEPAVQQYFSTVRAAFQGMEIYLDDLSRDQGIKDLTATLMVENKYQNFAQEQAYAIAFLLVLISIACLIVVALLRPKTED